MRLSTAAIAAVALLMIAPSLTGPTTTAVTSWEAPDGDHSFIETDYGYVRADYEPPEDGTHAIFFMEGYMGASTPANGLDYDDPVAPQPTHPTHYVRMPDGVLIGVTVHHEFSGLLQDSGFALVMASVRGTGCSGGSFDLFDKLHREDGARLIDWIPTQEGFEDEVAMFGASYSGITSLLVASEQPEHLAALSANMVIGDMYRDIAYPGGVPNIAFPGLWTLAYRPAQDHLGTLGGAMELDRICLENQAEHHRAYPTDHAGFGMYTRRTDDTMYRVRSPVEVADQIQVPTMLGQSFQDEQTGPRGGFTVWPHLQPQARLNPCWDGPGDPLVITPKNFVMTNGVHATSTDNGLYYALPWFHYWIKDDPSGYDDPATPAKEGPTFCDVFDDQVRVHWEKDGDFLHPNADGPATYTHEGNTAAITGYDAFPIPGTEYQPWALCGDGTVTLDCQDDSGRSYVHGEQRVGAWNYGSGGRAHEGSRFTQPEGPDMLRYRSQPLDQALTVLGPITLDLTASTTAPDTEFYVTVADVAPNGDVTYLQKGMLKASHRDIDPERSWYGDDGELIRASYTHTAQATTNTVTPGQPVEYVVDVFPLGHTFREDHRIQVQIHAPPLNDGRWGYGPISPPAINTVHQATLDLPVIDTVDVGEYPGCGVPDGYRCVPAEHHAGLPGLPAS